MAKPFQVPVWMLIVWAEMSTGAFSCGIMTWTLLPHRDCSYKGGARLSSVQLCTINPAFVLAVWRKPCLPVQLYTINPASFVGCQHKSHLPVHLYNLCHFFIPWLPLAQVKSLELCKAVAESEKSIAVPICSPNYLRSSDCSLELRHLRVAWTTEKHPISTIKYKMKLVLEKECHADGWSRWGETGRLSLRGGLDVGVCVYWHTNLVWG